MEKEIKLQNETQDEKGASMLEYALLAALIAVVAIAAVTFLGQQASTTFSTIGAHMQTANQALTAEICQNLEVPVGKSRVSRFSDGETFCVIQENVRGVDTYVVQPTCSPVKRLLSSVPIVAPSHQVKILERIPMRAAPSGSKGATARV